MQPRRSAHVLRYSFEVGAWDLCKHAIAPLPTAPRVLRMLRYFNDDKIWSTYTNITGNVWFRTTGSAMETQVRPLAVWLYPPTHPLRSTCGSYPPAHPPRAIPDHFTRSRTHCDAEHGWWRLLK